MITLKSARFDLKQEHIDKGDRFLPGTCPIALCIREQFPGYNVIVLDIIDIWKDGNEGFAPVRACLPPEIKKFIKAFDTFGRNYVKPMSFELNFTPLNPMPV